MDDTHTPHDDNGADIAGQRAQDALAEQKRLDALREQERMRRWIEDDEPLPVKMACKLSQHLIPKESKSD